MKDNAFVINLKKGYKKELFGEEMPLFCSGKTTGNCVHCGKMTHNGMQ